MKFSMIKTSAKALLPVCAALALVSPAAQAESTYGYNAAGTGPVSATATVNLKINVPLLILLRVGASGAASIGADVTLTAAPNPGIPGGIAAAALVDGNSGASGWDGTAPVMAATSSPASLTAYAWTNATGNTGKLTGAVTTAMTTGGPALADITVSSTPGTVPLAHPGANLSALSTAVTINTNSLQSSSWTYGLSSTALNTVAAGTYTATITYTASSI